MREIDINNLMSQLGISSIDFVRWQNEQDQHEDEENSCIIGPPLETHADLSDGTTNELSY